MGSLGSVLLTWQAAYAQGCWTFDQLTSAGGVWGGAYRQHVQQAHDCMGLQGGWWLVAAAQATVEGWPGSRVLVTQWAGPPDLPVCVSCAEITMVYGDVCSGQIGSGQIGSGQIEGRR